MELALLDLAKQTTNFIVCSNQNRSVLVCDLLSYNSLFVGQLSADKFHHENKSV